MRVKGEGPIPCRVMLVGEAPGEWEDRAGRPFVGKSGDELNRYFDTANLDRRDIYITNLVKERPPNNSDPTAAMIARDEPELWHELHRVGPEIVVAVGRIAARYFLGAVDMETHHSLAFPVSPEVLWRMNTVGDHTIEPFVVLPIYHPAAGMRLPDLQALTQMGFVNLRSILDGKMQPAPPKDQFPAPLYQLVTDANNAHSLPLRPSSPYTIAMDTEGLEGRVWGLSYSVRPGEAWVVKATETRTIERLELALSHPNAHVILHNALHDLRILRELGIHLRPGQYTDTMVMSYLLCLEPQGLKPLAFRHAGMEMMSYMEVVGPADRRIATEYLERVAAYKCGECGGAGWKLRKVAKWKTLWVPNNEPQPPLSRLAIAAAVMNGKVPKKAATHYKVEVRAGTTFKEVKCGRCNGDGTVWPRPLPQLIWEKGKPKEYQPQAIGVRVKKILSDLNDEDKTVDPRKRWDATDDEVKALVEAELGPMPEVSLDDVEPQSAAVDYSARDADATLRVHSALAPRIDALGLRSVLDMDMRTLPMFDRMQEVGMLIMPQHFHGMTKRLEAEMKELERELAQIAGHPVNPASSQQVAAYLFGELKFEGVKLTKSRTGESTDDKVLELLKLRTGHPSIPIMLRHRELHKLRGTYTVPLPRYAHPVDGRVRTNIRITRTSSGRPASHDPNLLNIPARSEEGKLIRDGFVTPSAFEEMGLPVRAGIRDWYMRTFAGKRTILSGWDLDQIEMRVLAHASQDPNLLKLFRDAATCKVRSADGKDVCHDIHRLTASLIYRCKLEDVTDTQRTLAKNIGFGIVYGITAKGLKAQMDQRGEVWTEEECQSMIDAYLDVAYPGVRDYMDEAAAEARRFGYVSDMFGRIRYLPAVHSTVSWVREEAIRQAGNHPIQAGAQGIMKLAMIQLQENDLPRLRRRRYHVEPVLQVYDEIILEHEEGLEDLLSPIVRRALANAVELSVPIGSKGHHGNRWSALK